MSEVREPHPYTCDCAACWTGIADREPKPRSLAARFVEAIRATLSENQP